MKTENSMMRKRDFAGSPVWPSIRMPKKVLLVEDDILHQMQFLGMFQKLSYLYGTQIQVDVANGMNDALNQIERKPDPSYYDLILCDYRLDPGHSGEEFYLRYLDEGGHSPFILTSAREPISRSVDDWDTGLPFLPKHLSVESFLKGLEARLFSGSDEKRDSASADLRRLRKFFRRLY